MYNQLFVLRLQLALTTFWNRLLPLMISRLMLSLKKTSRARESGWTSDALSRIHPRIVTQIAFEDSPADPEDSGGTTSDEIALSDLRGRSGGTRRTM